MEKIALEASNDRSFLVAVIVCQIITSLLLFNMYFTKCFKDIDFNQVNANCILVKLLIFRETSYGF